MLRSLTRPGDVLAVDALSYPGVRLLASAHGLDLAPTPVTATGPDLDALDRLCRTRPVRAIYAMPTLHNPLGWVLDQERRDRLVALARAHDCLIIEDGTYAFLDPSPPPPLQALSPNAPATWPDCPRTRLPDCGSVSPSCRAATWRPSSGAFVWRPGALLG